jgi:hypothetical protein
MAKAPVLFVLVLVLTFPLWIGVGGMFFGLMMGLIGGLIGAFFGLMGAIFGVVFGILGEVFHIFFGFGSWHGHHYFFNKYVFLALVIVAALVISKRTKKN